MTDSCLALSKSMTSPFVSSFVRLLRSTNDNWRLVANWKHQ